MKRATTSLVAEAWLLSIPDITAAGIVLPTDTSTWVDTGFVQVGPIFTGSPGAYAPIREPVVQFSAWAVNPASLDPDWATAEALSEAIVAATYDMTLLNTALTLRTGFRQARVTAATAVSDPERIPDDAASYARYDIDVVLQWIEIKEQS